MSIKATSDCLPSEITPRELFQRRRDFIKTSAGLALGADLGALLQPAVWRAALATSLSLMLAIAAGNDFTCAVNAAGACVPAAAHGLRHTPARTHARTGATTIVDEFLQLPALPAAPRG